MKTTWKIVFAFFLLLPLAGCEEECHDGGSSPTADSPSFEPIGFWYKSPTTGQPYRLNDREVIVYGAIPDGTLISIKTEIINDIGGFFEGGPGDEGDIIFINSRSTVSRSVVQYYIEFNGVLTDTLRIENERFNQGDCDEDGVFNFYYNDRFVFGAERYFDIFFIEKEF